VSLPAIKFQLFADALNAIGCTMRDKNGQHVAITVSQLVDHVQNRKVIECYLEKVRIELFVPIVPPQDEILRRAAPVRIGNRDIPITTAEDLILLKLAFHRIKDLQDVRGILWLQRGRLDLDYLRNWSARTHEPSVQQELERLTPEYSHNSDNDP
jgi:predicted nucleotidyltransferase